MPMRTLTKILQVHCREGLGLLPLETGQCSGFMATCEEGICACTQKAEECFTDDQGRVYCFCGFHASRIRKQLLVTKES